MQEPHRFDEQVLSGFRRWASLVGLALDMCFLRFLQLASVRHISMGLLALSVRSLSKPRSQYQDLPPPVSDEEMPVWHNVLVVGKSGQTYFSPKLVCAGKLRFYHLFGDAGLHSGLWKHVAPRWKGNYDCVGPSITAPPKPVPRGEERWDLEETWSQGWQKQTMLQRILAKCPHKARQDRSVWEQGRRLKLPSADRDFIQRVLWRKLQLGGGCVAYIRRKSSAL